MCEAEDGTWTLRGIVMMGSEGCDTYTVFVDAAAVVSWIKETMIRIEVRYFIIL